MSYREMRNMVEQLRVLGYPRLVSMENFRLPNFKLVCELLEWIVRRFDPQCSLPMAIDTEQERILFIKSAVFYLLQKAHLKLNPKKLYQADGYAAQELAVAVGHLHRVMCSSTGPENVGTKESVRSQILKKIDEIQACREHMSQLPQRGATLYDLLAKESVARTERLRALSYPVNIPNMEKVIVEAVDTIQADIRSVSNNLQNISSDEAVLDAKIERKKREFDQQQKRLAKLQSFRPQYMDEYEKLESKLKDLYAIYVLKFRNVSYLKYMQDEFDRNDKKQTAEAEQNMRNIVERLRAQELLNRNAQIAALDDDGRNERPQVKGSKLFGNMIGAGITDDEDDDDYDDDDDVAADSRGYGNQNDDEDEDYELESNNGFHDDGIGYEHNDDGRNVDNDRKKSLTRNERNMDREQSPQARGSERKENSLEHQSVDDF